MKKIVIDPGHGGKDAGATGNGLKEKDITLKIALATELYLNDLYGGHAVKLSRNRDETVSLENRTKQANTFKADLLLSIHVNAGGGTGFESFIYNGNYRNKQRTMEIQKLIHQEIISISKFKDRGQKQANFHMLRESNMSAVLVENGFIDTKDDAKLLATNTFIKKLAKGYADGIAKVLKLPKVITGVYHEIMKGDTLYSIAKKYGTSVQALILLNAPIDPHRLQIGSKIKIR